MRKSMKYTALSAVGALAFGASAAMADITVVSWGGAYTASQQKAYSDTWDGGTVNWENYNGGLGEVRAQVESGSVQWDIVDVLPHEARVGCDEGLFEELPRDMFTKAADGTSIGSVDIEVVFNPAIAKTYSGDIVITSTLGETTIGVSGIGTVVTGIDDDLIRNSDWKLYPNPANNIIVINLEEVAYLKPTIGIVSINGSEMWKRTSVEEKRLEVNVGSYPEGTYLVRIISTKGTVVKKLLIVR